MAFIKINKENFYHNLNQIALQIGSQKSTAIEKIAIVLKDNAYGHGIQEMAKLSSDFGIKHAVVRKLKEAEEIKDFFESILILGDKAIKDNIYSFAMNSLEDIIKAQRGAKVELKIDTGMHRNGIAMYELEKALDMIEKQGLVLVGVMTHFRAADELSSSLFWQQKNFENIKEKVKKRGFEKVRFHSHNSAAILRTKSFNEDLVRIGIGAYGYNELAEPFDKVVLKPVLSLHAKKISTRTLNKGQCVGYGADFIATENTTVSTYDLGYGDGWSRGDSHKPWMTAENLNILGRVSMDFITLASGKEEVCIMDDAQHTAKHFGTISYEIITALNAELKRVIV